MKRIVGIRPTGRMHLGHYASVIKPALDTDADVLIARYHSDSDKVCEYMTHIANTLHGFGIENHKIQELNADLYFDLLKAAPAHLLNAMPQYKTKTKTAHMYTYPVLMAHDLVGYDQVIVGEDQRPHIEFANDLFERLGMPRVEGVYNGGKIMSLRDSSKKMSSSEPESCLFLNDEDAEKKINKAVTTPEGRQNLENIFYLLGGDTPAESNKEFKQQIYNLYKEM